ncbi:colanic acid biosynthesis glycosyltransferase WcaL [Leucobacter sp. wl10]|nr:colanic acid biosynthesis glycosyltransferase WcaL [Leucobacter sp. wl10]
MHPAERIGYVVKVYPRFSETFIVSEILAREALGEDIEIIALRPSGDPRFHAELARVAAPVTYLPRPSTALTLWETLRDAAVGTGITPELGRVLPELLAADVEEAVAAVALAAHTVRRGLTRLHAHFASAPASAARLAAKIVGVPYSFTAHAKDIYHSSVDPDLLRRKIADAAYVATVSEFNARRLRALAPEHAERIQVVPNAIELDRFPYRDPAPPRRPLHIVAVGRLVEKKGFGVLLDAVAAAHEEHPVRVTIAGGGELDAHLAGRVRALGLDAVVRMPGPLNQDEIAALLRDADVFAAPCVIGEDGNADGLPTVLLEAMASGVPCIATRVTGIPEAVIDGVTGILCEPGDAAGLAEAIRAFAGDEIDRIALSRSARALIEHAHDVRATAAQHRRLGARGVTRPAEAETV